MRQRSPPDAGATHHLCLLINIPSSSKLLDQINSYLETRKSTVPYVNVTTTKLPQLQHLTVNDTPDFAKAFLGSGGLHVLETKTNSQQNNHQNACPPR